MYVDFPPQPNCPARKVIVIELTDKPYGLIFAERVIDYARANDATSIDGDREEIFWIVFEENPKRAWDMTIRALRSDLQRSKSTRLTEAELISLGDDAPIEEILATFDWGGYGSFARRELPRACIELEIKTLGELRALTRSEITGPRSGRMGNKALSFVDAVLGQFGMKPLQDFRAT